MAPHIPIEHPTLRQTAYEMILHAFLLSRADHSILLALVKDWPIHLYSVTTLTEAVLHRSAASTTYQKPCYKVSDAPIQHCFMPQRRHNTAEL